MVSLLDSTSALGAGAVDRRSSAILDVAAGGFSECTGLEMSHDSPRTTRKAATTARVLKFPSRVTWANITLKKGVACDQRRCGTGTTASCEGTGKRRDGVIVLLDAARTCRSSVWYFRRGLPVKYTAPSLNATQNSVAIESIEIAHEGLYQVPGVGGASRHGRHGGVRRWTCEIGEDQ